MSSDLWWEKYIKLKGRLVCAGKMESNLERERRGKERNDAELSYVFGFDGEKEWKII